MATATRVTQGGLPFRTIGPQRKTITDVALDTSYPTGGESVTASDLGLNYVESAQAQLKLSATTTVNIANTHYNESTNKLLVYDETPAEVANAANLDGAVVRITAWGW
jgi:hypothetical protein